MEKQVGQEDPGINFLLGMSWNVDIIDREQLGHSGTAGYDEKMITKLYKKLGSRR